MMTQPITVIRPSTKPGLEALAIPITLFIVAIFTAKFLDLWMLVAMVGLGTLIGAVFFCRAHIFAFATRYEITDSDIVGTYKFIQSQSYSIPLDSIRHVELEMRPLGRLLNFGDIRMTTTTGRTMVIWSAPNPGPLTNQIRQAITAAREIVNN